MKKETKEIKTTVYIARDGKEFSSEAECSEYEDWLNDEEHYEAAKEYINTLKVETSKNEFPFIPLDTFMKDRGDMTQVKTSMRRVMDNGSYYLLQSRSDAMELATVMAHDGYANINPEEILKRTGKLQYPCTVLVASSYAWDVRWALLTGKQP